MEGTHQILFARFQSWHKQNMGIYWKEKILISFLSLQYFLFLHRVDQG